MALFFLFSFFFLVRVWRHDEVELTRSVVRNGRSRNHMGRGDAEVGENARTPFGVRSQPNGLATRERHWYKRREKPRYKT